MATLTYFGFGALPGTSSVPQGLFSERPTATVENEGAQYFATDDLTGGLDGTLYISINGNWVQIGGTSNFSSIENRLTPEDYQRIYRAAGENEGLLVRPDATNTGYSALRDVSTLTTVTGDYTTQVDGEVISGKKITGILQISHKNVVVEQSWVEKYIRCDDPDANLLIVDSDIGTPTGYGESGKAGICFVGYTAVRCNIYGMGDGIKANGNAYILGCFIHDLYRYPIGEGDYEHSDGVQVSLGSNIDIIGNHLSIHTFVDEGAPVTADLATSCVLIKADLGAIGTTGPVRFWHNWCESSANYPIYVTPGNYSADPVPHRVSVRNNLIRKGALGYFNTADDPAVRAYNRDWPSSDRIGNYLDPLPGLNNGVQLNGTDTASSITTPYVAARTPQSLALVCDVVVTTPISGAVQRIISQLTFTANADRSFSFGIDAAGKLFLVWNTNSTGTSITATCTNPLPIVAGDRIKVGVWLDPTNPYIVRFYFANYGESLRLLDFVRGTAATVINDGNTPYCISGRNVGAADRFKGDVYRVEIRDGATGSLGIAGNLVSLFDAAVANVVNPVSPASLTSSTGEVWTLGSKAWWIAAKRTDRDRYYQQSIDKRQILPRVLTLPAVSNSYTPNIDSGDLMFINAPTANFTVNAPLGTVNDGQDFTLRILSGATGRVPTWDAVYQSSGSTALPTTALPNSKYVTFVFKYHTAISKFVLMSADLVGY